MIRALRLELVKPIDERWEDVGPLLRTLAKATPKLLNAVLDAHIAMELVGADAVKKVIVSSESDPSSKSGIAYHAVARQTEKLRAWGKKKNHGGFGALAVSGGMGSAIARAATQAHARRDQEAPRFASERILVRKQETKLTRDGKGVAITLKLRPEGTVRFAVAHSFGVHRETLDALVSGDLPYGDCKVQWDDRRSKWYALIAYEPKEPVPATIDPRRVLVVHRGVRNALFFLASTGASPKAFSGSKYGAQRRALRARMSETKRTSDFERGGGAKGHGKARRFESYGSMEDKLARVTHTFCQQAAAYASAQAKRLGCGLVVIEDYGGIEPDPDPQKRRVLDRFPLYELKQCIASRLERDGIALKESPAEYVSSTCPACNTCDSRAHNVRTGMFHCRKPGCDFKGPADRVAAFWLLKHSGLADMSEWEKRMARERRLVDVIKEARGGA